MNWRQLAWALHLASVALVVVSCAAPAAPTVTPAPTETVGLATVPSPTETPLAATVVPTDTVQPASPTSLATSTTAATFAAATPTPLAASIATATAPAVPTPTPRTNVPPTAIPTSAIPTPTLAAPSPIPTATAVPTATPPPAPVLSAKPTGGGTLAGVVTDTAGRPIPGAFVTVGFKTFKLVGQSDASGHYAVTGIPDTPGVEVFSFAAGYTYDHSGGFPIPAGRTTAFNVRLATDANPALDPVFSAVGVSPVSAPRGSTVTFSTSAQSSQTMSDEVIAASGSLGRSALFAPVGAGRYQATFAIPTDIPPGTYSFAIFGATEQCEENARFPTVQITVT